jgi:hypothetical protein
VHVLRSSLQLPDSLPPAALANRRLRDHMRSQTFSAWEPALAPYHAAENVSARGRRRGPGPPTHINPLGRSLDMCSPPSPLLHSGADVVFPFLCVLSGKLPYCHSVDEDSVPVHGLCPRPNCEVPITVPPPGTAGRDTSIERRWRCVQHYLLSCTASPCGCSDPTDHWADLWDLLPHAPPAREHVRLALHVDSFDADSVRALCMPWLLDPFSFLQGCSRSWRDAVCSVIAAFLLLVGASVADDGVPAGSCVFASGLVRRSLSDLALPPAPRVAGRFPLPHRPDQGTEAEALLG